MAAAQSSQQDLVDFKDSQQAEEIAQEIRRAYQNDDDHRAVSIANRHTDLIQNSIIAHKYWMWSLYSLDNYGEAITVGKRWITLAPDQSKPHYWLGRAYADDYNYAQAAKYLEIAANLDEPNRNTFNWWCYSLSMQDKYEEAVKACTAGIESGKKLGYAYAERANAHRKLGNAQAEKNDCRAAFWQGYDCIEIQEFDSEPLAKAAMIFVIGMIAIFIGGAALKQNDMTKSSTPADLVIQPVSENITGLQLRHFIVVGGAVLLVICSALMTSDFWELFAALI